VKRGILISLILPLFVLGYENVPVGIATVDEEPVVLNKVEAIYPREAYEKKIEGQVLVAVLVGNAGVVETARIVKSDNEIFNQATVEAAKQWLFRSVIHNKKPVKFWYNIAMTFSLWEKSSSSANTKPNVESSMDSVSAGNVKRPNEVGIMIDLPANPIDKNAMVFAKPPLDEKPILLQRTEPKYPAIAHINKISGRVIFALLVDTTGHVEKPIILESTNEIFIEDAITAAKQYRFRPAMFNGMPTKAWYTDSVIFRAK
jgi:TonB family protein